MKFFGPLSLLPSLACLAAAAFQGEADGLYEVSFDQTGEIIDQVLIENATSAAIERRDIPGPQNNCLGYNINRDDYNVGLNGMNSWCDAGNRIAVGQAMVAKYGASAVIICNHASGTQPCGSGENGQFSSLLDISCGSSGAGWVWVSQWGKSFGRDTSNTIACH